MSLLESSLDTGQIQLLQRFMDMAARRQALITGNIANVDTPGYRTRDIDFHGELTRAMQGDAAPSEPVVREVPGLIARPDGNNVSVDREGLMLAQTQLQFSAAEQLIKAEFKRLNLAIHEGSLT